MSTTYSKAIRVNLLRAHGGPYCYQYYNNNCRCALCKEGKRIRAQQYYVGEQRIAAHKARCRKNALRRKYGITEQDFDRILHDQGQVCAICGASETEHAVKWHVDHDHNDGVVRGILCQRCNQAIGLLGENPQVASRAATYLAKVGSVAHGTVGRWQEALAGDLG